LGGESEPETPRRVTANGGERNLGGEPETPLRLGIVGLKEEETDNYTEDQAKDHSSRGRLPEECED